MERQRLALEESERAARHSREVEALKLEQSRRTLKEEEDSAKLGSLKGTIHKLWEALESDPSEIVSFLMKVENVAGFSDDALAEYSEECARLTDRVPIAQAVTRREFLKYKL